MFYVTPSAAVAAAAVGIQVPARPVAAAAILLSKIVYLLLLLLLLQQLSARRHSSVPARVSPI